MYGPISAAAAIPYALSKRARKVSPNLQITEKPSDVYSCSYEVSIPEKEGIAP